MKHVMTFTCLALMLGCIRSTPEAVTENQAPRLITEQEARQIASDHANAYLKDKTFRDVAGAEHPFPMLPPTTWHGVERTSNAWVLICEPPTGPYAHVFMDLYGNNVAVTRHGFSTD